MEKYKIMVIHHSLHLECSEMCICGHHARFHHGQGSDGWCDECDRIYGISHNWICHNFTPVDARVSKPQKTVIVSRSRQ